MFIGTNYLTNEVKGSFWRPDDYMAKVPQTHVTVAAPSVNVTISPEGRMLASGLLNVSATDAMLERADKIAENNIRMFEKADKLFESEDGKVMRYDFDIHTGDLELAEA